MDEQIRVYKRNLPHWELPGSVYFMTFKVADEFVLSDAAKDIVFSAVRFHAGKKYRLHACVVMNTHVHLIFQPNQKVPVAQASSPVSPSFYTLAVIMHSIKSYSSHQIGKLLSNSGRVWLDENYDRILRDDNEYLEKMNYIITNPVKAGLVENADDYRWLVHEGKE